jgi:hypothetical protein
MALQVVRRYLQCHFTDTDGWLASSTRTENTKLSSVEGKQGAILACEFHFGGETSHHAEQCHER